MGAAFTKVARVMAGVIAVSMATISARSDVAPRVHSAAAPCGVTERVTSRELCATPTALCFDPEAEFWMVALATTC